MVIAASPMRHRGFVAMLLGTFAAFIGYALLLPVVPLWAVRQGTGEFVAGASTGAFMATTVLVQFAVPALARAFGYRVITALGAAFIGLPAPLLALTTNWQGILAVSAVRGIGFGLVTVCGSALVAELLPADALARGSGLYGISSGVPQLLGLSTGTWLANHWGFVPLFILAGAVPVAGMLAIFFIGKVHPRAAKSAGSVVSTVESTWRPWLVFLSGSIGYGAFATFLPIVFTDTSIATIALFATAAGAVCARLAAGYAGDRLAGPGRMLPLTLTLTAFGLAGATAAIAWGGAVVLAIVAVAIFGVGFGATQNDSLVAMFARAPAEQASVVWNVGFDAGQGIGAMAVGAVVSATSFSVAFGLLALFAFALLPLARRVSRAAAVPRPAELAR